MLAAILAFSLFGADAEYQRAKNYEDAVEAANAIKPDACFHTHVWWHVREAVSMSSVPLGRRIECMESVWYHKQHLFMSR